MRRDLPWAMPTTVGNISSRGTRSSTRSRSRLAVDNRARCCSLALAGSPSCPTWDHSDRASVGDVLGDGERKVVFQVNPSKAAHPTDPDKELQLTKNSSTCSRASNIVNVRDECHHETGLGSGLLLGRRVVLVFQIYAIGIFQVCESLQFFVISVGSSAT